MPAFPVSVGSTRLDTHNIDEIISASLSFTQIHNSIISKEQSPCKNYFDSDDDDGNKSALSNT